MALTARDSGGSDFVPAPAGTHAAVCVDVVNLGIIESKYYGNSAHKLEIWWAIDEKDANGRLFTVRKRYTLSLHEKASLRKDLQSWRGRAFTPEELLGFDVEAVIKASCLVNVVHAVVDQSTYANVAAVMPLPRGMNAPIFPKDYLRVKDRDGYKAPSMGNAGSTDFPPSALIDESDETLPF